MRLSVFNRVVSGLILSAALLFVTGCGGGSSDERMTYDGVTTEAVMDFSNAEWLAMESFINGKYGGVVGNTLAVQQVGAGEHPPRAVLLGELFDDMLDKLEPLQSDTTESSLTAVKFSDKLNGRCGGVRTMSVEADPVSGTVSGSIYFTSYCENDITLSGVVFFDGSYNTATKKLLTITLNVDTLSVATPNDLFTGQGTMEFDRSSLPITVKMDMLVRDDTSGDIFWARDYVLTIDKGSDLTYGDYIEVTLSGRFYGPHIGYVEINTSIPIRTYFVHRWPLYCEMTVTAKNKNGNIAKATLSALSASGYMVDIDLGKLGKKTVTGNWEDI